MARQDEIARTAKSLQAVLGRARFAAVVVRATVRRATAEEMEVDAPFFRDRHPRITHGSKKHTRSDLVVVVLNNAFVREFGAGEGESG